MDDEILQEQEIEASRELRKSRMRAVKEKLQEEIKEETISRVKKVVFKKVVLWILGIVASFFLATWWIWLIFLVIIVLVAWAKEDPAEFLKFFGSTSLKIFWDLLH